MSDSRASLRKSSLIMRDIHQDDSSSDSSSSMSRVSSLVDSLSSNIQNIQNTNINGQQNMNPFSMSFSDGSNSDPLDAEAIIDSHKSGENRITNIQQRFTYGVEGRHTLADSTDDSYGSNNSAPIDPSVNMKNWKSGGDENSLAGADCNTYNPTKTFFADDSTVFLSSADENYTGDYKDENFMTKNDINKKRGVLNPVILTFFRYAFFVVLCVFFTWVLGKLCPFDSNDNATALENGGEGSLKQELLAGGADEGSSCWCCCGTGDRDRGGKYKFMKSSDDREGGPSCWKS